MNVTSFIIYLIFISNFPVLFNRLIIHNSTQMTCLLMQTLIHHHLGIVSSSPPHLSNTLFPPGHHKSVHGSSLNCRTSLSNITKTDNYLILLSANYLVHEPSAWKQLAIMARGGGVRLNLPPYKVLIRDNKWYWTDGTGHLWRGINLHGIGWSPIERCLRRLMGGRGLITDHN